MATTEIIIEFFELRNNLFPFEEWLDNFKSKEDRERVYSRLLRLKQGNFGDCKSVGDGVFELRYFFGSGYRVYFGRDGDKLVLILCGGDKSTQEKDIKKAKEYWRIYNEQKKNKR